MQDGGRIIEGRFRTHSHSGHERNHLFVSDGGQRFRDVSAISGLDTEGDTRGFVLWDYDRDGWQDIALVNANDPLLNLYRNDIGRLRRQNSDEGGQMIAVRFVGGNATAQPSLEYGPLDGFGVKVVVSLGNQRLLREQRCGDGFAVQNSKTMIIGIGDREHADRVEIRWPSGKTYQLERVAAGSLLTTYENPHDASDGQPFTSQPYRVDITPISRPHGENTVQLKLKTPESQAALQMYTTMATWCVACKQLQPQLEYLNEAFAEDIQIYGVPVDVEDTPAKLAEYEAQNNPPYQILSTVGPAERHQVRRVLLSAISDPPLPSTIVTDSEGNVLQQFAGVPTASQLGRLLGVSSE